MPEEHVLQCWLSFGGRYANTLFYPPPPPDYLLCQMAYKMPFEPQHPIVFHLWGYPCSMVIEGEFVPKAIK